MIHSKINLIQTEAKEREQLYTYVFTGDDSVITTGPVAEVVEGLDGDHIL